MTTQAEVNLRHQLYIRTLGYFQSRRKHRFLESIARLQTPWSPVLQTPRLEKSGQERSQSISINLYHHDKDSQIIIYT